MDKTPNKYYAIIFNISFQWLKFGLNLMPIPNEAIEYYLKHGSYNIVLDSFSESSKSDA